MSSAALRPQPSGPRTSVFECRQLRRLARTDRKCQELALAIRWMRSEASSKCVPTQSCERGGVSTRSLAGMLNGEWQRIEFLLSVGCGLSARRCGDDLFQVLFR